VRSVAQVDDRRQWHGARRLVVRDYACAARVTRRAFQKRHYGGRGIASTLLPHTRANASVAAIIQQPARLIPNTRHGFVTGKAYFSNSRTSR
jgi:hypothetical protein